MKKSSIRILIVDDDTASSNSLAEVVRRMGFKPLIAGKASDALNVAKLQSVHAAIVDVLLPKMSGVELAAEFRKTRFGDAPIILVSGVFKDKLFASEAIGKTGAKEFLFKPFSADELMKALESSLAELVEAEKATVHSLLFKHLYSARERAKAIENLETIKGSDFPYILSILMNGKNSGSLNIVNSAGEIFGVTLCSGAIEEVDGGESVGTAILALISKGFLAEDDWEKIQRRKKRVNLEDLISDGYVSPHAVGVAKREQIFHDVRAISSAPTLQLNFIPGDDDSAPAKYSVNIFEMIDTVLSSSETFFDTKYLKEFYRSVLDSPLRTNIDPEHFQKIWQSHQDSRELSSLLSAIKSNGTLQKTLDLHPELESKILICVHRLVLSSAILFEDPQRAKALNILIDRFRVMRKELEGKAPDEVFSYFGVKDRLTPQLAEKIFNEYTGSNGPKSLPKGSPAELVSLAEECYQIVADARAIILDDVKREALLQSKRNQVHLKAKQADELTLQGLDALKKGRFQQASEMLGKAEQLGPSTLQYLIKVWADVKCGALKERTELQNALKRLESLSLDDRKSAYFYMALGLVKRGLGDQSANAQFERALQIEPAFVEAGRELNSTGLAGREKKDKKVDLLTGDLSQVVSQLFRRKVD